VDTLEQELREKSTAELIRNALDEVKLLAKAEVLHAKQEMRDEVVRAKKAGILGGLSLGLGLCGLAVLFVALALALPWSEALAALVVGLVLVIFAGLAAVLARRSLPKRPLQKTQERIRTDFTLAREQLA
jgi:hypothetical protein